MFDSVKTYKQVAQITESLNATIPQISHSAKGLARYMTHMDNPEKAQYKAEDIIALNGADLSELLKPSSQDRYSMIREMLQFIDNNQIRSEEHTSELQSRFDLVCRLLLE